MAKAACAACNRKFVVKRSDQMFCSEACRNKSWRWARRERIAAETAKQLRSVKIDTWSAFLSTDPVLLRKLAIWAGVIENRPESRV